MSMLVAQVFTSASTMAFKTFPCDDEAVEGESYLRADYSLSCKTDKHMYYEIYAGIMIVVRSKPSLQQTSRHACLGTRTPFSCV